MNVLVAIAEFTLEVEGDCLLSAKAESPQWARA
jgi:hypothetical protein